MSLKLTNRVETPERKRRYRIKKHKQTVQKKDPNDVTVGALLNLTTTRDTGKLMDLLTDAILRRVKKSTLSIREVLENFQQDSDGKFYLTYDSFCKNCTNVLRLNFTREEMKLVFAAIDKDKNGKLDFQEFSNLIASHNTHILRSIDHQTRGQLRKSQALALQKLRQRGARPTVTGPRDTTATISRAGHVHGHRLNVAHLKMRLRDTIWEKTLGNKGKLNCLFRNFQDSLVRNGVSFQSFIHGLKTCGLKSLSHDEEWALFNSCDKDGSGVLNFKQFVRDFKALKKPISKSHSTDLLQRELNQYVQSNSQKFCQEKLNKSSHPRKSTLSKYAVQSLGSGTMSNSPPSKSTIESYQSDEVRLTSSKNKPQTFRMPALSRAWDIDKSEQLYSVRKAPFGSRCM